MVVAEIKLGGIGSTTCTFSFPNIKVPSSKLVGLKLQWIFVHGLS